MGAKNGNPDEGPALIIRSSSCTLANMIIQKGLNTGLSLENAGSPVYTNLCFQNNAGGAVLSAGSSPRFVKANFVNN